MTVPENRYGRIVSYNIHAGVGLDGRRDPARIAKVLNRLQPDLVGLQEVKNIHRANGSPAQLDYLARATGLERISGPTLTHARGDYGNAVLTRWPVRRVRRIDLSFRRREPRGAIDLEINLSGRTLRVFVTHLGLKPAERRYQVRELERHLRSAEDHPTLLMGDFNEWWIHGRPIRWLYSHFDRSPAPSTYPGIFPILPLDRILVRPRKILLDLEAVRQPPARKASDHLPLLARIDLDRL